MEVGYVGKDKDEEGTPEAPVSEAPGTSFEAVQGVEHVVNTPLNKFGLPDPDRVVEAAYRNDDGTVSFKGGGK